MRVLGLALAGVLVLSASVAAHAVPLGGKPGPAATGPAPASSIYGVAAVGAGIPSPVIGASGEGVGFRRIARRTIMLGAGAVRTVGREIPMGPGELTAVYSKPPMEVGAPLEVRSKARIEAGVTTTAAGSIRSRCEIRSPEYLGRGFFDHQTSARVGLPGLIDTEGTEAVGPQAGISDRPAFLSHPRAAEARIGSEEIIVPLALRHVLCRRLTPFCVRVRLGRHRGRLY